MLLKIFGSIVLAIVLFVAGGALWFWSMWDTHSWNQKLTVTVATPQGEVSGSAITFYWVNYMEPCRFGGMSQVCFNSRKKGEATVVALPNGRYLFVLLAENPLSLARAAFGAELPDEFRRGRAGRNNYYNQIKRQRAPKPVPPKAYPQMVYFEDINDPASVREVDPDNLAASFGPGYALSSMTLQVTDEWNRGGGVDEILPWLNEFYNKRLDGNRYGSIDAPNRTANSLSSGKFKVGK